MIDLVRPCCRRLVNISALNIAPYREANLLLGAALICRRDGSQPGALLSAGLPTQPRILKFSIDSGDQPRRPLLVSEVFGKGLRKHGLLVCHSAQLTSDLSQQ